jgi:hypothetical protein
MADDEIKIWVFYQGIFSGDVGPMEVKEFPADVFSDDGSRQMLEFVNELNAHGEYEDPIVIEGRRIHLAPETVVTRIRIKDKL